MRIRVRFGAFENYITNGAGRGGDNIDFLLVYGRKFSLVGCLIVGKVI